MATLDMLKVSICMHQAFFVHYFTTKNKFILLNCFPVIDRQRDGLSAIKLSVYRNLGGLIITVKLTKIKRTFFKNAKQHYWIVPIFLLWRYRKIWPKVPNINTANISQVKSHSTIRFYSNQSKHLQY